MKIVVFGPDRRVGVLDGEQVVDVNGAYAAYVRETQDEPLPYELASAMAPATLQQFIEAGRRATDNAQQALEHISRAGPVGLRGECLTFALREVKLHAPLPNIGSRLMMAAGNYADHALGMRHNKNHRTELTYDDVFKEHREHRGSTAFWKIAQHVVGPDADIIFPARTKLFDYEAEVAIVIGKRIKDMPAGRARDSIWGYTLINDWSCRDPQKDGQGALSLSISKNFDTSASMGPCIVVDEQIDPQDIPFGTRVNGEVRQDGNTKGMIFSFDEFLEYGTRDMTFSPGDMISAGTCAGTANDSSVWDEAGKTPIPSTSKFLSTGDVVEISSPLIGTLRNRVVAKP
jgi:2-keto-4-pentenoate hydratase/2-oxohepta-3-ene-1,7-dioic acid hydratase in catechol pathway